MTRDSRCTSVPPRTMRFWRGSMRHSPMRNPRLQLLGGECHAAESTSRSSLALNWLKVTEEHVVPSPEHQRRRLPAREIFGDCVEPGDVVSGQRKPIAHDRTLPARAALDVTDHRVLDRNVVIQSAVRSGSRQRIDGTISDAWRAQMRNLSAPIMCRPLRAPDASPCRAAAHRRGRPRRLVRRGTAASGRTVCRWSLLAQRYRGGAPPARGFALRLCACRAAYRSRRRAAPARAG